MRAWGLFVAMAMTTAVAHATPVPSLDKGKSTTLDLRVVRYEGSSNGQLTVEVSNNGKAAEQFNAQGLYFVPNENADAAPQRVGAVGPLKEKLATGGWETHQTLNIPPGEKRQVRLDVFCIDSHRRSPQTGDKFSLASARMPRALATEITHNATRPKKAANGDALDALIATPAAQQEVWKARDKKWIKLEGEGKQEATK